MKSKVFLAAIGALAINTATYADYSFRLANTESCDTISGTWTGTAKASSWFLGTCVYHGTGIVSSVDSSGHFTIQATADKDSGSILCPEHGAERVNAVCSNGLVTVKTEFGNLKGSFSNNTGSAEGTLSVSPGIEADVSAQFRR